MVESLLENGISTRNEFRKSLIPKEVSEATKAFLLMDPLCNDHWGKVDTILEKIKESNDPVVVMKERRGLPYRSFKSAKPLYSDKTYHINKSKNFSDRSYWSKFKPKFQRIEPAFTNV